MPAPDGTLSDIEVATARFRLEQFFAGIGGRRPCPTCGTKEYYVIPQLNGNRSDTPSPNDPHFRYPAVMVSCVNCGYLEQYIAGNLGISYWTPPPAPPPPTYIPPPVATTPDQSLGNILGDLLKRKDGNDG